jgi:hypothetical protein
MKRLCLALFAFALLMGCTPNIKEIPAGYVGKILTPTGWQDKILEAGQVDLGDINGNGTYNILVILEASSVTMKEHFGVAGSDPSVGDNEDHRIIVDNTPLTIDIYTRGMIDDTKEGRDAIFAQITPDNTNDNLVKTITIGKIYNQFARMDVRGGTRAIFSKYKNYDWCAKHLDSINNDLSAMVVATFKRNKVPLIPMNVQVSNIKQDETVWAAQNQKQAAISQVATIDSIGQVLERRPKYIQFMKWEALKEIAAKNPNITIIVNEGSNNAPGIVLNDKK